MRLAALFVLCFVAAVGCAHQDRRGEAVPDRVAAANRQFAAKVRANQPKAGPPQSLKPTASTPPAQAPHFALLNPLVQPVGLIASINTNLRFVVIDFSLSRVPEVEQRLGVYRQGQKVGEVKISGPTINQNTVADLVAGEARVGDEVRED